MISTHINTQKQEKVSLITNIRQKVVYSFRFTAFILMRFVYYFLYNYGILALPPQPKTISTLSTDYIENQKTKFLASYEKQNQDLFNANIEKCFYDPKLHALEVEDADNELEKTWRRRILYENTPRGNVIMYYDAFKKGFVYYSDNSNIPYFLINAVVMKYVLLYRCRDFFVDNQITPKNKLSPLLDIATEKESSKLNVSATTPTEKPVLKSSAFAKLKNYNNVSHKLTPQNNKPNKKETNKEDEINKPDEKAYSRNKIIYSGKISNYSFLQKQKKIKQVAFSSDLLDGLKSNSDAQRYVFSYKDFKKLKNKQMNNNEIPENN